MFLAALILSPSTSAQAQGTIVIPSQTLPGAVPGSGQAGPVFSPSSTVPFQRPGDGIGLLGGTEPDGQYPPPQYYAGLEIYRSGDLQRASEVLDSALRSSRKDINGRWIDAIPALAMLSECAWHLGDLEQSKQYLDQIFEIAIRNRNWLGRVDFSSAILGTAVAAKPQWLWPAAAAITVLPVSDRILFQQGDLLTSQRLLRGGTIQERSIRPMDVVEIMRTLAIATHRRRMLLGALSKDDAVVAKLIGATGFPRYSSQLPFTRSLIGSLRTVEYFSQSDDRRVRDEAPQYAIFRGQAHPLTPVTLLAQAHAVAIDGQPAAVLPITSMIANAAAALEQPEWIGEAMQLAAGCCDSDTAAAVAQAAATAATSTRRVSRLAAMHCLVAAADASVTAGDIRSASAFLDEAGKLSSRRDVLLPRLDAYHAYNAARVAAATGASIGGNSPSQVDQSIAAIARFALNHRSRRRSLTSMPRLFQMRFIRATIAQSSSSGGGIGGRSGDQLLAAYSGPPPIDLWRRDPVDAVATCLADSVSLKVARAQLAAASGSSEAFLVASDDLLAARLLGKLPLGGRLAQVRALVSRDESLLGEDAKAVRNTGPSAIKNLVAAVLDAAQAAHQQPGLDQQPGAGTTIGARAEAMENTLSQLAISRNVFPPVAIPTLPTKKPGAALPDRTAMLVFIGLGDRLFGTVATNQKVTLWQVETPGRLPGEISRLLREIGVGKNRGKRIGDDKVWRQSAALMRQRLIPDQSLLPLGDLDRLIVVPHGPLWYLPLELLPQQDADSALLGDAVKIRYAATPGLAVYPTAIQTPQKTVGLASGKFFAPLDSERESVMRQEIIDGIQDAVVLSPATGRPASLIGASLGHVVVAATQNPNSKNPLATNVAGYDAASPGGNLDAWLRLPAAAPGSVALMGLRTPADQGKLGDGDELFTLLAGLQVAGVRDVLLSRWAVGGESSAILLRELTQELPFAGLADSFERARIILRGAKLDPSAEPLLSRSESDLANLTGDHPLFWSGYLLASPN